MPTCKAQLTLCLILIGVLACGGSPTEIAKSPTVTGMIPPPLQEPAPTDTFEPAPTLPLPTDTEEPPIQIPGGTEPAPEPQPEEPGPEEPRPEPPEGSEGISPPYDIHVTLSLQDEPCGMYSNSACGLQHLSTEAIFRNVRFGTPATDLLFGWGGIGPRGSGARVETESQVGAYGLCPCYEGDLEHPCLVTEGPKPFESWLKFWPGGDALPVAPLVGPTPEPLESAETFYLEYWIWEAMDGGRVMGWNCDDFSGASLGGGCGTPGPVAFLLAWDWVMAGQERTLEATTEDGWGTGHWTMRLVPAGGD